MNNRQWECRVKKDLCWKCNTPLIISPYFWGRECTQCKKRYWELILRGYKERIKNKGYSDREIQENQIREKRRERQLEVLAKFEKGLKRFGKELPICILKEINKDTE